MKFFEDFSLSNLFNGGETPAGPEAQPNPVYLGFDRETIDQAKPVRLWGAYNIGIALERQGIDPLVTTEFVAISQPEQVSAQAVLQSEVVVEAPDEPEVEALSTEGAEVLNVDDLRKRVHLSYTETSGAIAQEVRDAA